MADVKETKTPIVEPGSTLPLTEAPETKQSEQGPATGSVLPLTDSNAQSKADGTPSQTEPSAALPLTAAPVGELKETEAPKPESEATDGKETDSKPVATTSEDGWPTLEEGQPLAKLYAEYPKLVEEAGYNEVWGIHLGPEDSFHTKLILQKFLRANENDLEKAKDQLLKTLKWRKEYEPLKAVEETFDKGKFGGLGYVTELTKVPQDGRAIVTYNLYGAVTDNKKTFGDSDSFIRWRVALMELSLQKLNLAAGKEPIPEFGAGPDPYQCYQVHDYMNVSFLRQDPDVKASSKRTIELFSAYYPETLSRKFFINVPVVMGWMFTAVKMVLAKETVRKFTVMSYGNALAGELGLEVPKQYGGEGEDLEHTGVGPKIE